VLASHVYCRVAGFLLMCPLAVLLIGLYALLQIQTQFGAWSLNILPQCPGKGPQGDESR